MQAYRPLAALLIQNFHSQTDNLVRCEDIAKIPMSTGFRVMYFNQ